VLSVENWAEIRRLYRAEGFPIREIARVMGVSRNTVRAAIASDGPPKYERPRAGSAADAGAAEGVSAYPRIRGCRRR
jgi:transposase